MRSLSDKFLLICGFCVVVISLFHIAVVLYYEQLASKLLRYTLDKLGYVWVWTISRNVPFEIEPLATRLALQELEAWVYAFDCLPGRSGSPI